MQKEIIATIAVASVIIIGASCKWFASKATNKQPFSIVGKWQVDTVYQLANDGTKNWFALAFLDTTTRFKFNADSTFSMLFKEDSTVANYLLHGDTLLIKQDSLKITNLLVKTNDSLITITSKDSFVISLKCQ